MNPLSNLSIEIAACRISRGWDQASLGERLGVSTKTISNWEDGQKIPRPQHILALRELFDIDELAMRKLVRDALNFRAGNFESYSMQDWNFVREHFESYTHFTERLVEIDHNILEFIGIDQEGTATQWAPILKHHRETWKLLVHNEKIVGYWHFIPLKEDVFRQSLDGTMIEAKIDLSSTEPIIGPGNYNIFISMMGVEQEHRIRGSTVLQLNFIRTVRKLAASGIFFSGISACALSLEGLAVCEKLGMRNLGRYRFAENYEIAQIFAADGKQISEQGALSEVQEIRKRYSQRFPEHVWLTDDDPHS